MNTPLTVFRAGRKLPPVKGKSHYEHSLDKKGQSWKSLLRQNIDRCIIKARDWDEFLLLMQREKYEIKSGKYISFRAEYTMSDEIVEATAEDLKPKSKLSFKSDDEYVNSEESVEIDGAEFVGQKAEEKTESKLKDKKTRNSLKKRSSAAEKLTDKDGNSVFYYEGEAPPDRKLTRGEKKLKRTIRKDEKRVFKLEKRLDKAESKLKHQRVFHVRNR